MDWAVVAVESLRFLAFGLVVAAVAILYVAHRRSRATVFADLTLKATMLILAVFYLALVRDWSARLPGDPALYGLAVGIGYALVGGFFLAVAVTLWRYTVRTDGAIIVSGDFLAGLRTRTTAMYGEAPSRFIVYAVGKESAEKAVARFLADGKSDRAKLWSRLPRWFRAMGYGKLRYLSEVPGREVRVVVEDTVEAHGGAQGGCDLTRGYLAGLGAALHPGRDCECVEVRCGRLQGGRDCEFTLHWFPQATLPTSVTVATADG